MEQTKLKRFKRILLLFIFAVTFGLGIAFDHHYDQARAVSNIEIVTHSNNVCKDTVSIKDSLQAIIINEVKEYLSKQSPKANKFIPKYLVQAGLNNNIDICFMMAQTQIETNFGTAGAGREESRRSLFGVAIRRYANYESAINDYCTILKKSYLGKGRTEKHLMTKYVTHSGARYAGNPNYEAELSRTYKDIVKKTNIYALQLEWHKAL